MEIKELEEMAVKEAKETIESGWFIDNSDGVKFLDNFSSDFNKKLEKVIDKYCEETGEFYMDIESEISDRILKKIQEMENSSNISGTLNHKFYSFYVNSEKGKNLTVEDFSDAFEFRWYFEI